MIKNLYKDNKAQTQPILLGIMVVIMGFGMLTIGNYLYFSLASNADAGTQIALIGTSATGNLNISGNTSNNDLVNITSGTAVYRFEFNTSVASPTNCNTANCIIVNVFNTNKSLNSATNLTAAINANASTAALVTATTVAGTNGYNYTTLTYTSRGVAGNSIALAETGTNIAKSGTTLLGGVDDVTGQASQTSLNNYASITFPIFGLALMILGFGVIFFTLKTSFGDRER